MAENKEKQDLFTNDLDARLLNPETKEKNLSSSEKAGALKRSKRQNLVENNEEEPSSLRQAVLAAKKAKEKKLLAEAKSAVGQKIAPIRKGTSTLLRAAWINLIDTFGLTVIWINIHVFLGMVMGNNVFCELGEEWTDKVTTGVKSEKLNQKARNTIGLVEKVGLGCLNLGCLVLILAVLAQIAIIINIGDYAWDAVKALVGFAWENVKNLLTGIIDKL